MGNRGLILKGMETGPSSPDAVPDRTRQFRDVHVKRSDNIYVRWSFRSTTQDRRGD